ncbi:MAG: cell division protein ZapA [Deltaproteobacteria bacterium]|nr:cell division protein ZapA [Deltaproteobacteria bacterium]
MSAKPVVAVSIRGQEFRIRTDDDEASLRRVAQYLDDTMATVEKKTGTVDTLQLALLSALNLARELVELRESGGGSSAAGVDPARFESLIELAESALEAHAGH